MNVNDTPNRLIIESHLGQTDCTGCHMYQQYRYIFAKRVLELSDRPSPRFKSLPIKIAEMPSMAAAEAALLRIAYAIKTGKTFVDLTDIDEP